MIKLSRSRVNTTWPYREQFSVDDMVKNLIYVSASCRWLYLFLVVAGVAPASADFPAGSRGGEGRDSKTGELDSLTMAGLHRVCLAY